MACFKKHRSVNSTAMGTFIMFSKTILKMYVSYLINILIRVVSFRSKNWVLLPIFMQKTCALFQLDLCHNFPRPSPLHRSTHVISVEPTAPHCSSRKHHKTTILTGRRPDAFGYSHTCRLEFYSTNLVLGNNSKTAKTKTQMSTRFPLVGASTIKCCWWYNNNRSIMDVFHLLLPSLIWFSMLLATANP